MNEHQPDLLVALAAAANKVGPVVASMAGAIVSLSFLKHLTVRGRLSAVLAGTLIAVYVAPAVTDVLLPHATPAVIRCIHFLLGVGGLGSMPAFLIWLRLKAGDPLGLVRSKSELTQGGA